jgi:hypothetical protein
VRGTDSTAHRSVSDIREKTDGERFEGEVQPVRYEFPGPSRKVARRLFKRSPNYTVLIFFESVPDVNVRRALSDARRLRNSFNHRSGMDLLL